MREGLHLHLWLRIVLPLLLVGLSTLGVQGARAQSCDQPGFVGHWHTSWGPLSLRQERARVVGDFDWSGVKGTIEGQPQQRPETLPIRWRAADGRSGQSFLFVTKSAAGALVQGGQTKTLAGPFAGWPAEISQGRPLQGFCVARPISAAALAGEWEFVQPHRCDDEQARLRLSVRENHGSLVATVLEGDACMPPGVEFWRGKLRGLQIEGEIFIRATARAQGRYVRVPMDQASVSIAVVDLETIIAGAQGMRRVAPREPTPDFALVAFNADTVLVRPGEAPASALLNEIRPFRAELRYPKPPTTPPSQVTVRWEGGEAFLPLRPAARPEIFVTDWRYLGRVKSSASTREPARIAEADTQRSRDTIAKLFAGRWQVTQSGGPLGEAQGFAEVGGDGRTIHLFLQGAGGERAYRAREALGLRGGDGAPNFLEVMFDDVSALAEPPSEQERRTWPQGEVIELDQTTGTVELEAFNLRIAAKVEASPKSVGVHVLLAARADARLAGAWNSEPRGDGEGRQSWSRQAEIVGALALDDQLGLRPNGEVDLATAYPFRPDGSAVQGRRDTRVLFVYGRNLPVSAGDALVVRAKDGGKPVNYTLEALPGEARGGEFEDGWRKAGVTNRDGLSALLLRARLPPGVPPGVQSFSLNQSPAAWRLDFADAFGRLRFTHRWRPDEFTPADALYTADTGFLVIDDAGRVPHESLSLRLSRNGAPVGDQPLTLRRVGAPGDAEYQSPPLRLIRRGSPQQSPPPDVEAVNIEVAAGDTLEATLSEPLAFRTLPPVATARVVDAPGVLGEIWLGALRRTALCYGASDTDFSRMGLDEAETYSKFILTERLPFVRRSNTDIRVTKGDHAAAILIRDEILAMLRDSSSFYRTLSRSDDAAIRRLLAPAHQKDGRWDALQARDPLGAEIGFGSLAGAARRADDWRMTREQAVAYAIAEARRALESFAGKIEASAQRAQAAGDCNLAELLVIAGQRADQPVQRILPRLVRLAKEAGHTYWVPDDVAQAHLRGLRTLGEALRALDDYARIDDSYKAMALALATAGAATVATVVGYAGAAAYMAIAGDVADMVYFGGRGVADYVEGARLVDYARGAAPALGTDFLAEAQLAASSVFQASIGLIAPGVGAALGARGLRELRNAGGIARGAAIADRARAFDATALGRLSDAERADLAALYIELQARRLRDGATSLTPADSARLRKFESYFNQPAPGVAVASIAGPAPSAATRLAPVDLPPAVHTGPAATAPTVRMGPEATAPTVRLAPDRTTRLPPPDLPPAAGGSGRSSSTRAEPEALQDIPAHVLPGRSVKVQGERGAASDLTFGEWVAAGTFNDVYRVAGRPGTLVRISKNASTHPVARFDQFGRDALDRLTRAGGPLERHLGVVSAESFTNVVSSFPGLNGRTVSIVQEAETIAARQITNRTMSPGQAIAVDDGVRALNRNGYAILDAHDHNFFFQRLRPGADEWKMVIIDPGGVAPARGATAVERAANARELQRYVDNPPEGFIPNPPGAPIRPGGILYDAAKFEAIRGGPLPRLIDEETLGLRADSVEFRPTGAEPFANARGLFDVPDKDVAAAYSALRAGEGQ